MKYTSIEVAGLQASEAKLVLDIYKARIRAEFVRLLTEDSETSDARRREFNQAIFWTEEDGGRAIWTSVDLDMVMSKFDKAVKNLERS